jgi:hypothetical protein
MKEFIAVDLDGTLATYEGWHGPCFIGKPVGPMVERVKAWLKEGKEVRIFTSRITLRAGERPMRNVKSVKNAIRAWCQESIGQNLLITNVKEHGMVEFWDDRAVRVERNTGRKLSVE